MKKILIYIVAVVACMVYVILLNLVLQLIIGIGIKQLGELWKGLLLGPPLIGIWASIVKHIKKNDRNKNKQDDSEQQ